MQNPRFALFVLLTISVVCTGLVYVWANTNFIEEVRVGAAPSTPTPTHRVEVPVPTYEPLATTTAYALIDISTGRTLHEKSSRMKLPIASITKLMTAMVAEEKIPSTATTTITKQILATLGESGRLKEHEVISQHDLLHALLLESSNDAATALAMMLGTENFIAAMNTKARELEMLNTIFADGSGISSRNVSTIQNLTLLATYILAKHPKIFEITRVPSFKTASHTWYNFNVFSSNKNFVGGKTGFTFAAKETMLAVFNVAEQPADETHMILTIILGSGNRKADIEALLLIAKKEQQQ